MMRISRVIRNERGASAAEFAMLAPVLFSIVIGAAQMGILFFANTGLQHAVGEGARVAMIFPRPADATIKQAAKDAKYGLDASYLVGEPLVTYAAEGDDCVAEIRWSYNVPLNFIFYQTPAVTLEHTRRVFLQAGANGPITCDAAGTPIAGGGGGGGGGGGTSSGGTSSTSTGGTSSTSTGSTSTGGTTSTSSGGTTSGGTDSSGGTTSTSASSASGGSTTTSTSGGSTTTTGGSTTTTTGGSTTTTSSGNNGSSGGDNNGSSGNGKGSDKVKDK